MARSATEEAVLALNRFGMGPRPGSIAVIQSDPRGALIAELERGPAHLDAASTLPSSARAYRMVIDANAKRQAKAILAKKAQEKEKAQEKAEDDAKKQQMAMAAEGSQGSMGMAE